MISSGEMRFDAVTHEYTLNGSKFLSVTQLLKKHGLAEDYSNVEQDTLDAAAARGNLIHEEVDEYVKTGVIGFTSECADFARICKDNNLMPQESEFVVYNEEYGIAGTVDIRGIAASVRVWLGDNKTTARLNKESLAWQLSLYEYLTYDGALLADKLYGFHLLPEGKSKLVEVSRVPREEVLKLLELEKKGEQYRKPALVISNNTLESLYQIKALYDDYNEKFKIIENNFNLLKTAVAAAMREQNIKTFENELIRITYTAPGKSRRIDTKKLKVEMPDIAKQFEYESETSEKLTITLRENNGSAG